MTTIDAIIIHCSATKAGQDLRAKDIDRMHRVRGFNMIGYNFVMVWWRTAGRCQSTGRTVTRKASPVCRTINTVSVSAISAGWILTVSRLIPVRKRRKRLCVIWLPNSVRSIRL